MNKKFFGNLKYAMIAQATATCFSLLMYLVVPKVLGTASYGYWQLFLLYTSYSGFFHLGLTDGVYLKLGGKSYEEINHRLLGSQLKILSLIHIIVAVGLVLFAEMGDLQPERLLVIRCFATYVVFYNIQNFIGFVFQAVNETRTYSVAVILEKSVSLIATVLLVVMQQNNFAYYVFVAVGAMALNSMYLLFRGRKIVVSGLYDIKITLREMGQNIRIGSILMFAGIASILLVGSSRMIVDYMWGIEVFGKLSFAISMTNMLLLFIRQISVVLFPALRQLQEGEQKAIYQTMIESLRVLLPLLYVAYIPMNILLSIWLPAYKESLIYLSLLLPLCLYDGKMQMLFNTYFKVLRKEKFLLGINVLAMVCSIVFTAVSVLVFDTVEYVAISIVIAIAIRSVVSEYYMKKLLDMSASGHIDLVFEFLFSAVFIVTAYFFNELIMLTSIVIVYVLYLVICPQKLEILKRILEKGLSKLRVSI